MKTYIIVALIVSPFLSLSQNSRSGKPTDSLSHITEATTYLAGQIKEDLSSYSFKPLKLVATLSDSIPDFSKLVSGSEAAKLREQFKNFYATFAFRCTTYVYEYTNGYSSFTEAFYDIETRLHPSYGTPWNLAFPKMNDYSKVRHAYVVSYTSLTKKKESGLSIDYVPFTFFGFSLNNLQTAHWYFITVKGTVPTIPVTTRVPQKDSLTALIFDFGKPDGDKVRIGGTVFEITKDTLVIRFLDSLRIQAVSTGTDGPCTVHAVIKETGEFIERETSLNNWMILKPKKPKTLASK
jgi:hypothetical protein